jgi:hypothetical protein
VRKREKREKVLEKAARKATRKAESSKKINGKKGQ